jgi:hypothetical protein
MGEEGSRGIHQVNRGGGRNATTQAASHTGGVSEAYARHETDGGGQPQKNHGRSSGARGNDQGSGGGGIAGFDTMDAELLKREGLGHNFGRVNRLKEKDSDASQALNHVGYTPTWKAGANQPRPSPAALAAVSDFPGWHNAEAGQAEPRGRGGFSTGRGQENEVAGGGGTERKNGGKAMSGILGGDWEGGGTEHRLAPQLYELHPGVSVPVARPKHGGALAGGHTHNKRGSGARRS